MELWAETGDFNEDYNTRNRTGYAYKRMIKPRNLSLGLVGLHKQYGSEAAQVFYGQNEFRFSGVNGVMIACDFIHKIGIRNWNWAQHLTIGMPLTSEPRIQ